MSGFRSTKEAISRRWPRRTRWQAPPAGNPAAATLVDDFEDGTIGAAWTVVQGTVTESAGRLHLDAASVGAVASVAHYSWQGSAGFLDVAAVPSGAALVWFETRQAGSEDNATIMQLNVAGATLNFAKHEGGVNTNGTPASVAYDPAQMRYWRQREAGGSWFFDTSPDGTTWTNRSSVAAPPFAGNLQWFLFAENGTGNWSLEAVNVAAVPLPPILVAPYAYV